MLTCSKPIVVHDARVASPPQPPPLRSILVTSMPRLHTRGGRPLLWFYCGCLDRYSASSTTVLSSRCRPPCHSTSSPAPKGWFYGRCAAGRCLELRRRGWLRGQGSTQAPTFELPAMFVACFGSCFSGPGRVVFQLLRQRPYHHVFPYHS
jgi:hypothetical protein